MRWITKLELWKSLQTSMGTLHNSSQLKNLEKQLERKTKRKKKTVPIKCENSTKGGVCSVWDHWEQITCRCRAILLGISGKSLKTALVEGVTEPGPWMLREISIIRQKRERYRTLYCWIYVLDTWPRFTAEEKKDFDDRFINMLRSNNPAFLLRIVNAYFSKLLEKFKTKYK